MSRAIASIVVGLLALTGCAGARTQVVARSADVPVSMSRAVRDADGVIVSADRREVVGQFDEERTAWGMLYSAVKLTPEKDISNALNAQVERAHGDAVVSLSIATRQCGMNWALLLNILPFWPGCANVHVHGDIIRVHPAPTNASARTPESIASFAAEDAMRVRIATSSSILFLASFGFFGCAGATAVSTPPASHVPMMTVTEQQDEWLYDHCEPKGTFAAPSRDESDGLIRAKSANFAEVVYTDLLFHAVAFACRSRPDWAVGERWIPLDAVAQRSADGSPSK